MKHFLTSALLVAVIAAAGATQSLAGDKPLQLALFNPVQVVGEDASVKGLRLNLIYGKNANMTGLDLGLANHATGEFGGLQFGLVGIVDGGAVGWQDKSSTSSRATWKACRSAWST